MIFSRAELVAQQQGGPPLKFRVEMVIVMM